METGWLFVFAVQTAVTLVIGFVGWSFKSTLNDLKTAITKNRDDIESVKKEVSDLKSDLPLVYVLREDFIRTLNNVDKQMGDVNRKLDRILQLKVEG